MEEGRHQRQGDQFDKDCSNVGLEGLKWKAEEKWEELESVNSNSKGHSNGVNMRKEGRAKEGSCFQPAGPGLHSPVTFSRLLDSLEPWFCSALH